MVPEVAAVVLREEPGEAVYEVVSIEVLPASSKAAAAHVTGVEEAMVPRAGAPPSAKYAISAKRRDILRPFVDVNTTKQMKLCRIRTSSTLEP